MPLRLQSTFMPGCALVAVGLLLGGAAPVQAQSAAYATVSGTVSGGMGEAVPQAVVTLIPTGGGAGTDATTSGSGSFAFRLVRPGRYELRVEALGYRPLVARTLSLSGGDDRTVDLTLTAEPPPVLTVDTVRLANASAGRWRVGAAELGEVALARAPHRFGDVGSIASLSTSFDEALGAHGLPGTTTAMIVDGVPYHGASHPVARAEKLPAPLFPAATLTSVAPAGTPSAMAWPGSTGGYLELSTLTSTEADLEIGGFYSGDPTWSSNQLDIDTPSLLSYEGTVRGTVPVRADGSRLVLVADVLEHQTPLTPRLAEPVATELSGLDAEILSALTETGVETYSRYAGLARLDLRGSGASSAFVRASGGYARRTFEGAGSLVHGEPAALGEESIDFSLAGGYVSEVTPSTLFELRGGVSGSYRDFESGPLDAAPAWLVGSASALADAPSSTGASSRTDVVLTPMVSYAVGGSVLRGGVGLRFSSHSMERGVDAVSEFLYPDAAALVAGRGFGRITAGRDASFGTQEYGVFAEYEAPLGPGLELRVGGRYDLERIAGDGPALNGEWFELTGLANALYPTSFHQLGLGGAVTWDPTGADRTRVTVAGSVRSGDIEPRAIAELFSPTVTATSAGADVDWPAGSLPDGVSASPTLTLFGPDVREPRTTTISVGMTQRLGSAVTFNLEGSSRRTDFLMRRRDLNLPVAPFAEDPDGRPVLAELEKDGGLVTATGDDARRFSDFDAVWALDPDGWSEYRAASVGLEYASDVADLFGSYTYSETTDNWVGASSGLPEDELRPTLPEAPEAEPWDEGVSDFDVPHRVAAGVAVRIASAEVSGLYRYRSGLPFTPGYRVGADVNGDGSLRNDPAFVPDTPELTGLLDVWPCLEDQVGGFAERNSCRGPDRHTVDARLRVRLGEVGGRVATLTVDGLNLVEYTGGVLDQALLLVDPDDDIVLSGDGSVVTVPVQLNDAFDTVRYPTSRGRMVRIGLRIGG